MTDDDLTKMRFDYAWKWFAYHADQRIKAFNFMILTFGILTTAFATSVDKHMLLASKAICIISMLLSLLFSRLDRRNRDLVFAGEDVLKQMEKDIFFKEGCVKKLLTRPEDPLWRGVPPLNIFKPFFLGKHRIVIPMIAYLFGIMFLLAFIYLNKLQPATAISP